MAYTYNRKSTIDDLKREGFQSLQFECQGCARKEAFSLSDFAGHLSYEIIFEHGSSSVKCAKKTHYLKPLRPTDAITRNVSAPVEPVSTPRIDDLAIRLNNKVIGSTPTHRPTSVVEELSKLIQDQAELSAKSASIRATGRTWPELLSEEQATLVELEKRKLYMHALKKVGWGIAITLGMPTFF